ncbi:hypothetical protein AgCh_024262 [Apium graveolens]
MATPPRAAIRCCAVASIFVFLLLIQPSFSIYCDEDDCYDLLGVTQSANSSEIKKAYYKLSLKHHPDKNPDPESKKLFVKIANAYEAFYNMARYYQAYYGHKTDPRAVLVGLLVVLSAFQYLNQWTRYNQALDMVKKSPAYKNRLRALELERSGGVTNKKKSNKQTNKKVDDDLSKELDLQIKGAEKPSIWDLLGIRFILLPYTIAKLLLWHGGWFWRYQIKKAPYSWNDASYLTQRSLGVPHESWRYMDDLRKDDLIERRLWEKSNMDSYVAEMRKESKRRR